MLGLVQRRLEARSNALPTNAQHISCRTKECINVHTSRRSTRRALVQNDRSQPLAFQSNLDVSQKGISILDLPSELLLVLFDHLALKELVRCTGVNRKWRALLEKSSKYWQYLHFISQTPISLAQMLICLTRARQDLRSLSLNGKPSSNKTFQQLVKFAQARPTKNLSSRWPCLTSLNVRNMPCIAPDIILELVHATSCSLKHLELAEIAAPSSTCLDVILQTCHCLITLKLARFLFGMQDNSQEFVHAPRHDVLQNFHATFVRLKSLQVLRLVEKFPNLQSLELGEHGVNVLAPLQSLPFEHLTSLGIHNVGDSQMTNSLDMLLARLANLKHFKLIQAPGLYSLRSLIANAGCLESITLEGAPYIPTSDWTDLFDACAATLTRLDLWHCPTLTDACFEPLQRSNLEQFKVSGIDTVSDMMLAWLPSTLVHLNVSYTPVTSSGITRLLARCPNLRAADVSQLSSETFASVRRLHSNIPNHRY